MEKRWRIDEIALKSAPATSMQLPTDLPIPNKSWKREEDEAKLLRELLYCFHGIGGQLLTVKHQNYDELPVFQLQVQDEATRQKVLHLAALSSMAKYLDDFIEQSCIDQMSLYRGALASALQKERSHYVRMLSEVECQLSNPDRVSLARLRCQLHLAKRRLQWQVQAVRVHRQSLLGCNVLSALYVLVMNGNPTAFDTLSTIFLQVSEVFYEQLTSWFRGHQICDPFNEFFIVEKFEAGEHCPFSRDTYYVNELAWPQFLTKAQTQMILTIGQNYNWLSAILKEKDLSALQILSELDQVVKKVTTDAHDGVNAWEARGRMHLYLVEIEARVSRELIKALLDQAKLMTHLRVLTGFLLFKQSGFAALLMTRVFDQSCQNASAFELQEKIQRVISKTLAPDQQGIHPELRIDLHFNQQPDDCCWDDFDVNYKVQKNDPLSLILTERVLQKYYKFFKDTLRLKRIDWILCDILKSIKTTVRKIHLSSRQPSLMEQIHLLTKEMLVLTQQLLYNILSARLHTNWQTLAASVKVVKSLRELEEAHDKYLDGIHSYIFPEQMHHLLQLTFELNDIYRSFRKVQEPLLSSSSNTSTPSKTAVCPSNVPSRLTQLRTDFNELIAQLLAVLSSAPEEHMQHLYELINVNGFFEPDAGVHKV